MRRCSGLPLDTQMINRKLYSGTSKGGIQSNREYQTLVIYSNETDAGNFSHYLEYNRLHHLTKGDAIVG